VTGSNDIEFGVALTDTGTVACQMLLADLSITKTDGVTSQNLGSVITYTIVASNAGPSAANNAVVTDPVATGLTKTAAACTTTSGGATCPVSTTVALLESAGVVIPTLPAGGSVTFTVTATLTAVTGSVTNSATIAPPQGVNDPTPGNNTASDTDSVSAFSYTIVKQASSSTLVPNSPVTFTILVVNNGPSAANNSVLTDPAVSGFNITDVSCGNTGGGAVCPAVSVGALQGAGITIATLPSGGSMTFTLTGTFTAQGGSATNTATISPPQGVPVPPASSSATVNVPNLIIPTLSELGMLLLGLMMLGSAAFALRGRKS
jgi:uncharacterized repeat protein (TIGR01451 family)